MPTNPTPIPIPAAATLETPPRLGGHGAGTVIVPLNLALVDIALDAVLVDIALDVVLDDVAKPWGESEGDEATRVFVIIPVTLLVGLTMFLATI